MVVLYGILALRKTFPLWKQLKIVGLVGCVYVVDGTAVVITHDVNLPVIVVMSSIGHLFLLATCILQ